MDLLLREAIGKVVDEAARVTSGVSRVDGNRVAVVGWGDCLVELGAAEVVVTLAEVDQMVGELALVG